MTLIIFLWCLVGIVSACVWKLTWSDVDLLDLLFLIVVGGILGPIWIIVILLTKYGDKTIIKKK